MASCARLQRTYEVPALTVGVPFDERDVLELELDHRQALFEGSLNLISIRPGVRDKPYAQKAGPVLDELKISYMVPERPVDSEHVGTQRSLSP
jgi:hypothetical protein